MREKLAALMHEIWGKWWHHIFQEGSYARIEGEWASSFVIPDCLVERWNRQMTTLYDALSEKEKDSGRQEADKVLASLEKQRKKTLAAIEEARYAMVGGNLAGEPVPPETISRWLVSIGEVV